MNAEQIKAKYAELENRYSADAPVAMLAWCGLAVNSLDDRVQALVPYLKEAIVSRELAVFRAKRDHDDAAITDAYIDCADQVRAAIGTAVCIEIMAPNAGESD